jgi:hypothetical protein
VKYLVAVFCDPESTVIGAVVTEIYFLAKLMNGKLSGRTCDFLWTVCSPGSHNT